MTSDRTTIRRRYSVDFKAKVLDECPAPCASVAKVAMSHGINTNVVRGWRKLAREAGAVSPVSSCECVPVVLPAAPMQSVSERGIEVELLRGASSRLASKPSPSPQQGELLASRRDSEASKRSSVDDWNWPRL